MYQLLKNRSVIRVTGPDALQFLQSNTTNDLVNNKNCYNYLLSPQGKYLYDFFVSKISNEELLIDIDSWSAEAFIQKLNLYKMRKEVKLEDLSSEYSVVYTRTSYRGGPQGPTWGSKQIATHAIALRSSVARNDGYGENNIPLIISYQDTRFHKMGFRSIIKTEFINNLDLTSENLYFDDKYKFAIPDGVSDLIFDRSIPLHFGGEELSAISFSKGCYVGQEVISRAKYQGVIRKKIFKVESGTKIAFHEPGAEITDISGDKIGVFCSSYNNLGIVLLDEEKYLGLDKKSAIINAAEMVDVLIPEWRR